MTPLIIALSLAAQPAQPDSLGTAEVIAMRRQTGIATAAPVQAIDSAAMARRGITDMGDALRRFAGVNLRDYGGAGGLKTVSVRGMGAAHTAVTYDGVAVADSHQGQIDLGQFSVDRLTSVSLQTLEGGALLCPVRNTAAAVVSLQTPWLTMADDGGKRWHTTVALRQASFCTWAPSVAATGNLGKRTSLSASADYYFALNNYPFTVENGVATERLRRTNSRMQRANVEVNLRQLLGSAENGGELLAKIYFNHNHRRLPGMVLYYVNENNERLEEQNAFGQISWKQTFGKWDLFAAGKQNWQTSLYDDHDAQYPGGLLSQHYWQRETYVSAGAALHITPQLTAAYATDGAFASLNSNLTTDRDVDRQTWLQSLSLQWRVGSVTLQARAIGHLYWNGRREGGSARNAQRLTPSATVLWQAIGHPFLLYVRAGYKETFRMPTFTELYYYHMGSASLTPELARQASAGVTLQASPARWWRLLTLTADAYYSRIEDRIVSIPYNLHVWRTVNMGDVRTLGIDATLESQWQLTARHALVLNMNYTYQRCRDYTSPTLSTWHKQLGYTPEHSGAASLAWENPWANISIHTTAASKRWCTNNHLTTTDLPAYSEWGAAAYRTLRLHQVQLTLRADLMNAFNKHYEVVRRYPMPGRSYRFTVKLEF